MKATSVGIRVFGGNGYAHDLPLRRCFRDTKPTEICEVTSEVQRLVIAGSLIR